MNRLTRDGTAEPVSRDQILRHARGQGNIHFPCPADHEQDWQPYPVDPYSAIIELCDDYTLLLLINGLFQKQIIPPRSPIMRILDLGQIDRYTEFLSDGLHNNI